MATADSGDGAQLTTAAAREVFFAAYDRLLALRTTPAVSIDLASDFGSTRVHVSGPENAPAVVLLHAYQATSGAWNTLADLLSTDHRVYAVDVMGDAGYSVPGRRSITSPEDLVAHLDTVLDGLGVTGVQLCGHSFGAWMAFTYALARPARVQRLVLLDPTMCFGPLLKGYILRAIPALLKPTSQRRLSLIRWESRQAPLDHAWLEATGAAADAFRGLPTVPTKIPAKDNASTLKPDLLVILAGRGRVNHARTIAKRVGARLPTARVDTLATASHYAMPLNHAAQIADAMTGPAAP